jgi:hypothetical protein
MRLDGLLTFWSPRAYSRRGLLVDGLSALGYNKFVPQPRSPAAAFRDALEAVFAKGYEVHRLKNTDCYEVIQIERQEWPNANIRTLYAMGKIDLAAKITFRPWVREEEAVLDSYNQHLGLVRGQQLGECLTTIIDHLGGVRLRPSGGIYWLPGQRVEQWREVAGVVEPAGQGDPNRVYLVQHPMGADEVRAVRDAVIEQVSGEALRIQKELDNPDPDKQLGERALETRKATLMELRKTIREYEGLLGVGLQRLASQVEAVELAAAQAAMMAAVEV